MAADSSMKNIAQVEQYAKDLEGISREVRDIFTRLKRKTDEIGQNWSDTQFNQFHQIYNDMIMKQTQGTCDTLQKLAIYAKKQCEFNRMAQQHKLNL